MRSAQRTEAQRPRPSRARSKLLLWPCVTRLLSVHLALFALLSVLAVAISLLAPSPAVAAECDAQGMQTVQAADLTARLESWEPVFLSCVDVQGRIEVRPDAGEIGPFFLIQSLVEDGIDASFVRFGGPLHFDGTCFRGDVDLQGAVFEDEVNWARASFDCGAGPVKVLAAASRFHGAADLRAQIFGEIDFTDASFAARTLLQGAEFRGEATFRGALFEDQTSFRGAIFSGFANFENVTALADVDFSSTEFHDDALFRRFSSPGRVSLRDADFTSDFNLDRASISNIELSRADFRGTLHMADVSAGSLQMTPSLVGRIDHQPTRLDVLRLIERSAKAQSDTGLANSALFQRQALETRQLAQPKRAFWLGIELTTGYLVRPLRPLTAIAVVALIGFGVRLLMHSRALLTSLRRTVRLPDLRSSLVDRAATAERGRSSWHLVALIAAPAGRALNAAINPRPPKPDIEETDGSSYAVATLVWTEYLVQKLLVVVFLVSLGNANPTIREIITSIH
jgi:uncharacterized protein YjbI with pentapeptide repeats